MTACPATRPRAVIASFSCVSNSSRCLRANSSTTRNPMLWRVRSYCGPGLPRPTMRRIEVSGAEVYSNRPDDEGLEAMKPERIVVIDDNASDAAIVRRRLERAGYHVRYASSGEEGLRLIHDDPADCVLVDFR